MSRNLNKIHSRGRSDSQDEYDEGSSTLKEHRAEILGVFY